MSQLTLLTVFNKRAIVLFNGTHVCSLFRHKNFTARQFIFWLKIPLYGNSVQTRKVSGPQIGSHVVGFFFAMPLKTSNKIFSYLAVFFLLKLKGILQQCGYYKMFLWTRPCCQPAEKLVNSALI